MKYIPDTYKHVDLHLHINVVYKIHELFFAVPYISLFSPYRVRDLWLEADRPFVPVNDLVTFNMSMYWGGQFTFEISWGDGTPDYAPGTVHARRGREIIDDLDPWFINTHSYAAPGNYTVVYSFENVFGVTEISKNIVVQYPIADLALATDQPVTVWPGPIEGDLTLTISFTGVNAPTEPYHEYDYGDGSTNGNPAMTLDIANQVVFNPAFVKRKLGL